MPRFALVLGIASLGCSLSIAGFFVGVPLGLLSVLLAYGGRGDRGSKLRRVANRALGVGALGLTVGLGVWFLHVRAAQTAYHIPPRQELSSEFNRTVGAASAPAPGAPPRTPTATPVVKPETAKKDAP